MGLKILQTDSDLSIQREELAKGWRQLAEVGLNSRIMNDRNTLIELTAPQCLCMSSG